MRIFPIIVMLGLSWLAACVPVTTPVPVPTVPLIPATATYTPPPVLPSATPQTLPVAPQELQPTADTAPLTPIQTTGIIADPALVRRVMGDLAAALQVDTRLIRFVRVDSIRWLPAAPGCSQASALRDAESVAGYSIALLAGTRVYTYYTGDTDDFRRCPHTETVHGELLLAVDAIAQEMVMLVQRRLAQELDLPQRRIQIVDMTPYTWADTSLGCPLPEQTYTPRSIDGYRIIVSVGETDYAFHTDSERAIPCPAGRETLPKD